jgi:hypothetical protein
MTNYIKRKTEKYKIYGLEVREEFSIFYYDYDVKLESE